MSYFDNGYNSQAGYMLDDAASAPSGDPITLVGTIKTEDTAGDMTLTFDEIEEGDTIIYAATYPSALVAGYTQLASRGAGDDLVLASKVAGAGEPLGLTIPGDASGFVANLAIGWVLRNAVALDGAIQFSEGSDSLPDCPSLTTSLDGSWVFAVAMKKAPDASPGAVTGWSTTVGETQNNAVAASLYMVYKGDNDAGSYDPGTWSDWAAGGVWYGLTAAWANMES